jgi:hypothetical protein
MFWKILPMNMSENGTELTISGDNQTKLTIDENGTVSADRFAGDGSSLSIGGSPLEDALSAKVDTAALDTELSGKVDATAFNTALAEKVDTAAFNTALAGKVDTAAFNTALAGKVDTAALTAALTEKVDKNAFNAAIGQKLDVTGGTISGDLTVVGDISANKYQGDGAKLTGKVSTVGDIMTGPLTINSTLSVSGMLTATDINATGTLEANALKFGDGTTQTSAVANVWETSGNDTFYNKGNVGIGATRPGTKLDVEGEIRAAGVVRANDGFRPSTNDWEIARDGGDLVIRDPEENKEWARFKDDISLHLTGTPSLWVDGKVGVGTTDPKQNLSIQATRPRLALTDKQGDAGVFEFHEGKKELRIQHWNNYGASYRRTMMVLEANSGNVGIGTATPTSRLEVNGFTESLGVSVNNAQNTGVGRGLWLWSPTDSSHVIYSANPSGKSPANKKPAQGFFDARHRLRLRTARNQGFLFENNSEVALVDIDSDTGNLWNRGALYCGNSDLYFSKTNHNHSRIGNTKGYAAIENAKNYDALMILGRAGTTVGRKVRLWDYLEVNGPLITKKSHTIKIGVPKSPYGNDGIRGEPNLWLDAKNKVIIKKGFTTHAMDIAERFKAVDKIMPGDVVVFDGKSKAAKLCGMEGDNRVVGVVSGNPGFILGTDEDQIPIALCGRVPCKVDANFAPIDIGDLLTTSKTKGHAQKVTNGKNLSGAVIGKALESLDSGKGEIMIFVFMQ